jgi:glutamine amidotransferase
VPSQPLVVVLDHGADDHTPLAEALTSAGVTADKRTALVADGLVVAGSAPAAAVMPALLALGAEQVVDRRLAGGRPVLAIGVGMHLMFTQVVQDGTGTDGLGEWTGVVGPVGAPRAPVPVATPAGSVLFAGLEDALFDISRAHAARTFPLLDDWPADTRLVVAVENGPLVALHLDPASSGTAGTEVLARWVSSLPVTDLPE